jgi:hypothetical protein
LPGLLGAAAAAAAAAAARSRSLFLPRVCVGGGWRAGGRGPAARGG